MLLHHSFDFNIIDTDPENPNYRQSHKTPLQVVITSGRILLAYAILDRGARVSDAELAEAVAFMKGSDNPDDAALLKRLLTGFQGAAPTAIARAIDLAKPNILQLLLAAGVDPTGKPKQFGNYRMFDEHKRLGHRLEPPESVLEIPCRDGNKTILEILLHAYPWSAKPIGRALALSILFGHSELVEYLLNWPLDVNQEITIRHLDAEDQQGLPVQGYNEVVTPLQIASRDQQLPVVKMLLKRRDIDVNYLGAGVRRRTALQHAVENGNMELVNLILDHPHGDINAGPARDGGATALQMAAIRGYLGIAKRLIDLGGEINAAAATVNGRTALEGAAEHGRIDMLQMLLDNGASVTGVDGQRQFNRAIGFAEKNGHHAAARLLISFEPQQE